MPHRTPWTRVLSGLMVTLIVSVIVSVFYPPASIVAGLLLLSIAIAGSGGLPRGQKITVSVLATLGTSLWLMGVWRGHEPSLQSTFSVNQTIVAMILAVSFVTIVAKPRSESPPRLIGIPAVFRTALASHLLGSVINLSAVTIVGDQLKKGRTLSLPDALLLSRTYSVGAYWSPFWAAAAVALAFAPGADVSVLVLMGFSAAMGALVLGTWGVARRLGPEVAQYKGYALNPTVIALPVALVSSVVTTHFLWPEVKTTNLVLMSALGLTFVVLAWEKPRGFTKALFNHAIDVLPAMRSESILFAGAGVLASGFAAFLPTAEVEIPDVVFGVLFAWLAMISVIILSTLGVHQIISIGVLATVTAPLAPNPTLFAMACTIAWGTSAALSPISGLNLFIMGRYRVDAGSLSRGNLLYALGVVVIAAPVLVAVAAQQGVGW